MFHDAPVLVTAWKLPPWDKGLSKGNQALHLTRLRIQSGKTSALEAHLVGVAPALTREWQRPVEDLNGVGQMQLATEQKGPASQTGKSTEQCMVQLTLKAQGDHVCILICSM